MRSQSLVPTLLGVPCLILTLLLAGPGVTPVRADAEPAVPLASEYPAAPACGETVSSRSARVVEEIEQKIARQRAALRDQARADASAAEGVVVLNNNGYNYDSDLEQPVAPTGATGGKPSTR